MPRARSVCAAVLLALTAGAVLAQTAATITLSADAQKRLGVATQTLAGVKRATEVDAFAKVLDPAPLTQLESDYETAVAAAAVSHAEAVRSRRLFESGGSVAAKDLEAAESQAQQDALKAANLRTQFDLQWGPGVGRMSEAARKALVAGLVKGDIALVHVDTHNNDGQAGARVVKVDVGDDSVAGTVLGPARQAEPRLQSSGLIVEIGGPDAIKLSVGLTNSAHIEAGTNETGVTIPRSAVIRFRGSDWAYVRTSPTRFERRLMLNPEAEADGFFVAKGFAAGDQVVTAGAIDLFAADQGRAD
ncbi:MAG TPA: hypothetical protein VGL58_18105 [Caulobacteraceae bacterium]|jgi:hypothetical protein